MRMSKSLLSIHDVAYATSLQTLFTAVSLAVLPGDRIALIGRNGSGKSTLLQLMAGLRQPDSGSVIKNGVVVYVPQLADAASLPDTLGAWLLREAITQQAFAQQYRQVFASAAPDLAISIANCSGGERTKLLLTFAALKKPAVLLLDEPTNHLDRRSLSALERWLKTFSGSVVFVSHNQAFTTRVATTVWEIAHESVVTFGGGFAAFRAYQAAERAADARALEAANKALQQHRRGVELRETKAARATKVANHEKHEPSRSKSAEKYFKNRSEKGIGRAKKQQDKKLEALEARQQSVTPPKQKTIAVPLQAVPSGKRLVFSVDNLTVHIGDRTLVSGVTFALRYGDRVALHGDNGSGKSVLLATLLSAVTAGGSEHIQVGTRVAYAFIDQQYALLVPEQTVLQTLETALPTIDTEAVYQQLGRFQFPSGYAHKRVWELSGGEQARLVFAVATLTPLDLLVLDEPTNNLDSETVEIILEALNTFTGAMIVVSHDDYFLERLTIQQTYAIQTGTFRTGS